MRVPVPDGSVVDLTARLRARPKAADVNAAVKAAAEGPLRRIVQYSEVPLVSSDIIGNPHSSIFDALSTRAEGDGWVKVVSWYDNEWGYSMRVVDLIETLATLKGLDRPLAGAGEPFVPERGSLSPTGATLRACPGDALVGDPSAPSRRSRPSRGRPRRSMSRFPAAA
jgi:hypothetical protein